VCDELSALTVAQHAYLTELKVAGAAIALGCLGVMWVLARRGRSLDQTSSGDRALIFDLTVATAAVFVVAGVTVFPELIAWFLIVGFLSIVAGWVGPIATAGVYVAAVATSAGSTRDVRREQWFIRVALLFYWLVLLVLLPGVMAVLATHVSPICFE
jgi:hypothetical protein